jgi:serpin B
VRDSFYDKILPTYIEGLQNNYGADVISDSFENADKINQWISNQTLGIIKQTLNDEDINEIDYALVNALAIDMKWNYALQCAIGSTTETKDYDVSFAHEDYTDYVSCLAGDYRELMEFNGVENVDSAKIGATINNYDIVATLGEDAIRDTIKQEYKKWYNDEKSYKPEGTTAEISEAELDTFVKELDENYHTSDTSTDFYWNETDDAKVFAKDLKEYDGATLQYVGIMPKNSDLDSFISSASAESISELIDGVKEIKNENFEDGSVIRMTGNIPFFKYQRDFDLTEELPKVGIETMFSDEADLSKMISEKDQKIDFMIHKADIDFSNDGIKAAAVTIGGGKGNANIGFDYKFEVPVTEIDVTFDKPFFYIIRDKSSNEVWFVGSTRELEAEE